MICILVGAQWGDEGKGKLTDFLAEEADVIVRYQGGNNAGHTVVIGDQTFKLHHLPSGVCRGKDSVLGNGVVLNPLALYEEMLKLEQNGLLLQGKVWLSDRLHVIQPQHILADQEEEAGRATRVGTTGKGIGPAYCDKVRRHGIRLGDWQQYRWPDNYAQALAFLAPWIVDTTEMLHQACAQGRNILLEGAQGTFLDIDHGTYPFVTSSNPTSGGACTGSGLPPTAIDRVIGILKAYTTRVGNGPFPTEELAEIGQHLQTRGAEVGTTTGRLRRCGWLDLVMANYARKINGISGWVLTKLDVLSGLENLQICTEYRDTEGPIKGYPAQISVLATVIPQYQSLPGWAGSLENCRGFEDLPREARDYIALIEDLTATPVDIVSFGPERSQTLVRKSPWA